MGRPHDPPDTNVILADGTKRVSKPSGKVKEFVGASKHTLHQSDSGSESPNEFLPPKKIPKKQTTLTGHFAPTAAPKQHTIAPSASSSHPIPPSTNPAPVTTVTATTEPSYSHRPHLPGRPSEDCAADHHVFKRRNALAYHFLIIRDRKLVTNDDRELVSCTLQCSHCHRKGSFEGVFDIDDAEKWAGSTGRFNQHFERKHEAWWRETQDRDEAAGVKTRKKDKRSTGQLTLDDSVENVSVLIPLQSIPVILTCLQSFTWDGFHEKVVCWQIASNQPFDEVEDQYFIDMMAYTRRSIADKLLKADAMKNRAIEYSKESCIRLKNILHVNAALLILF